MPEDDERSSVSSSLSASSLIPKSESKPLRRLDIYLRWKEEEKKRQKHVTVSHVMKLLHEEANGQAHGQVVDSVRSVDGNFVSSRSCLLTQRVQPKYIVYELSN